MGINSYEKLIWQSATKVGLQEDEAATLTELCAKLNGYHSYEQLRMLNEYLAAAHPEAVKIVPQGVSNDYPDGRQIDLAIIGDPSASGKKAYLEGPGHAPEFAGATTVATLEQLVARHPDLLKRLGYSCLLASSHIDPDGMELQRWPLEEASLRQFVLGAYRGSWQDQISWGYPTEEYDRIRPETQASLETINTYRPDFVGSMHASQFAAYIVASRCDENTARELSRILHDSGLQ